MTKIINDIREKVKQDRPLIHCITNPISINQCANTILAVGGRAIMAEHPLEVREITGSSNALMLNMGNITDAKMESFLISASAAREKNIPIVLDAVGVACSSLRKRYVTKLFDTAIPTVIKGNYSEIYALYRESYSSPGIDADVLLTKDTLKNAAESLARQYNNIILVTGKNDIITDGRKTVYVNNGTPRLSTITGTGCMLGALCASYLASVNKIDAVTASCVMMGICGQEAQTDKGNGTYFVNLMDALSTLTNEKIEKYIDIEVIKNEKI